MQLSVHPVLERYVASILGFSLLYIGEERKMYKVLVGKPEGRRPLGRPRCRWEDGVRMDIREIGLGGVDWIRLAQDRDRWQAVVSVVMNLRVLVPRRELVSYIDDWLQSTDMNVFIFITDTYIHMLTA
jgi:hypothetical protein